MCVLALADPGGRVRDTWEGRVEGRLLGRPRGQGGFGYDSVFLPESSDRTFAELAPEEKAVVSHRGRALRQFREALPGLLAGGGGGAHD